MKREKNEFLTLLCNLYIIALLVVLPLYTGDGYGWLGDTKYMLFRNVSVLCLGCWLAAGMPGRIRAVIEWIRTSGAGTKKTGADRGRLPFNRLDCAVAAYGVCVVLSAVCSSYGKLAWTGYDEWYMGAVSQLLFVGIYFFVSRQYDGTLWPLYLGEAALFAVTILGLLHRLGIDPLGMMKGWTNKNWGYSHMLSTLGNINWLCGYYSVALAFLMAHFLRENKVWLQLLLYPASVSAFVLLGIQGSLGGWLILAVCIGACLLLGWRQSVVLKKICLLLVGFFLCMPLMELLMKLRGDRASMPTDGNVFAYVAWYAWIIVGIGFLLLFFLMHRAEKKIVVKKRNKEKQYSIKDLIEEEQEISVIDEVEKRKPVLQSKRETVTGQRREEKSRIAAKAECEGIESALSGRKLKKILVFSGMIAGLLIMFLLFCHSVDDSFGSGRGFLWHISLEWFSEAGIKERLIGAGPDCYGAAVFQGLGSGSDVWKGERWEQAVFTNAHNEFLSQLCNIGILGTVSYVSIFLVGISLCWKRCHEENIRKKRECCYGWLGFLALSMYGAHSLISFQQVLNAPLLFLVLGLYMKGVDLL